MNTYVVMFDKGTMRVQAKNEAEDLVYWLNGSNARRRYFNSYRRLATWKSVSTLGESHQRYLVELGTKTVLGWRHERESIPLTEYVSFRQTTPIAPRMAAARQSEDPSTSPEANRQPRLSRCTKLGDLENNEWIVALKWETQNRILYLIRRSAIMHLATQHITVVADLAVIVIVHKNETSESS